MFLQGREVGAIKKLPPRQPRAGKAGIMNAITRRGLVDKNRRVAFRQSKLKFVIFRITEAFVEATDYVKCFAPNNERRGRHAIDFQQQIVSPALYGSIQRLVRADPLAQGRRIKRLSRDRGGLRVHQIPDRRKRKPGIRMLLQKSDLLVQLAGKPDIVRVQQRDILSAGLSDSEISRRRDAARRLEMVLDPVSPGLQPGSSRLGRAVDQNDFVRLPALRKQAF